MKKKYGIAISFTVLNCLMLVFQSCTSDGGARSPNVADKVSSGAGSPELVRTTWMSGLESPWDMAFMPDGTMFFTEKCRGLSVRLVDGSIRKLFGTAGSSLIANDFFCQGQTGMHGVVLDPNFAQNRNLFVYMSSSLSSPRTNRVVRLQLSPDLTSVSNRVDIITDISFKNAGNSWGGAGAHSGGRIRFGPDGFLYVPTGDNHNGTLPQDLSRLGGKVLRVDRNGQAAPGNQTPAGGDPRIFTFGHRNVQGLTFHPQSGQVFVAEHGPGHSDEVTALVAGGNGGWDPKPEPGVNCNDNYCGYISNKPDGTLTPMTDTAKFPNAMKPVHSYSDSAGMGPCVFLTGSQWKGWDGFLLVGIMAQQSLDSLRLNPSGALESVNRIDLPRDRFRSLVQGPDGNLYIATDSGEIWKVTPQ